MDPRLVQDMVWLALAALAVMLVWRTVLAARFVDRLSSRAASAVERTPVPTEPLPVVLPLKGWDPSFPDLLEGLQRQTWPNGAPVPVWSFVVVDADHPHLDEIRAALGTTVLHPSPCPAFRSDKVHRMRTGFDQVASELGGLPPLLATLDSDVVVDGGFFARRLAPHLSAPTAFSFAVPLSRDDATLGDQLLRSFTNHFNLWTFLLGLRLFPWMGTGVGPSMCFATGRHFGPAFDAVQREVIEDQALGHYFERASVQVALSPTPVVITKDRACVREALDQAAKWIRFAMMARRHTTLRTKVAFAITWALGALTTWAFVFVAVLSAAGWVTPACLGFAAALMLADAASTGLIEARLLSAEGARPSWAHLVWVPLTLLAQPLVVVYAVLNRNLSHRGGRIARAASTATSG